MESGERVVVLWHKRGWLPGTFVEYCSGMPDEEFSRVIVDMDTGEPCLEYGGYHPDCVKSFPKP